MAAIEVEGGLCIRRSTVLVGAGLTGMLMLVVAQMLGLLAALVPAIRGHGRPAELERQQGKHEDGKPAAHFVKSTVIHSLDTGSVESRYIDLS